MQNALNPSWWHQTPTMQPLEALRITAEHLERGEAVPKPASNIIARALRQYLAGQTDITRNLGLRPQRGGAHETPLALEKAAQRNTAIVAIYEALPGTQSDKAKRTAALLSDPMGQRIDEADVIKNLDFLFQNYRGALPNSARQIINIAKGATMVARLGLN